MSTALDMSTSIHSDLFNVFSASVDGRLENVRTRHNALRKLSLALKDGQDDLKEAFGAHSNGRGRDFDGAVYATLRNLALHAASLDQTRANKEKKALSRSSGSFTHQLSRPVGVVAVELPEDLSTLEFPLDAVFGPVAAALTAGNCIVIVHPGTSTTEDLWLKPLERVFLDALDRETFAFIAATRLKPNDWQRFGRIVRYSENPKAHPKHDDGHTKVVQIAARPRHVVVVDHSLIDERSYRHPNENPGVLRRDADKIADITDAIEGFMAHVSHVLVTETILPLFRRAWAGKDGQRGAIISSVLSTQDTIYQIQELASGGQKVSLNVYIFAKPATASFFAQHIDAQSISINGLPMDMSCSYIPTTSSARILKTAKAVSPTGFVLEPLWSPGLFAMSTSTILLHTIPKSKPVEGVQRLSTSDPCLAIETMKRQQPDHMEFFPTGFKITFFPLAVGVLSGLGYVGFRFGVLGYRFARSRM